MKVNCYKCKYRADIAGDAHSCCTHPEVSNGFLNRLTNILGIVAPCSHPDAKEKLGIVGDSNGVDNGWFNWPENFDPVWLKKCNGFDPIEKPWWEDVGKWEE